MRLKDKVAIVTGSSKGFGRVIAETLAEEGAKIVLNDIDEEALKATAAAIEKLDRPVLIAKANVAIKAEVEQMVRQTVEKFGCVDILVNNAGGALGTPARLDEVEDKDWNKVLDVNLKGAFLCCQAVIAQMRKQGTGGKVVNVSALAGRSYATLAGAQYSSAKAGIGGLTRHLAREAGPDGINVNAVAPTVMLTGERVKGLWQAKSPEQREKTLESIPLRRLAEPKEVAKVVLFLASDDASYVTGVTLDVNGGRFMC